MRGTTVISVLAGVIGLAASGLAFALEWNLQPAASSIAAEIHFLHEYVMLWVVIPIFVGVFGVMFYGLYKHRKSVGHQAQQFHENTTVEIIWTIIPFVILIGMAYPATKTIIAMKDTSNPDITIKATGYQWKWGYDYLQEGVSFYANIATPRDQIDGHNVDARKNNPNYLLEVDN